MVRFYEIDTVDLHVSEMADKEVRMVRRPRVRYCNCQIRCRRLGQNTDHPSEIRSVVNVPRTSRSLSRGYICLLQFPSPVVSLPEHYVGFSPFMPIFQCHARLTFSVQKENIITAAILYRTALALFSSPSALLFV